MAAAEVSVMVAGRRCTLRASFGALEAIAEHEPQLGLLVGILSIPPCEKLADITSVIEAGLAAGDAAGVTCAELVETVGIEGARALARDFLIKAHRVPDGQLGNWLAAVQMGRRPSESMDGLSLAQ